MHQPYRLAALALLSLMFAACTGTPGASPTPRPSGTAAGATPSPSPSGAPTANPTAPPHADVAVVRIEHMGGMMPPWETMRRYPQVAMYADGRLITEGPQIELYPGPALPNLVVTRFSQHGVEQVLDWAAEAGLQGPDRQLGPVIVDAGALVFSVTHADGTTHNTSVNDMSANDPEIGALRAFQDVMLNLRQWLADDIASGEMPYAWDRLRVVSFPADPETLPDPNFAETVDWPLSSPATRGQSWGDQEGHRCWELSGDELETARSLFTQANELTLYRADDDVTYQFYLHPLLPDDEACPGF